MCTPENIQQQQPWAPPGFLPIDRDGVVEGVETRMKPLKNTYTNFEEAVKTSLYSGQKIKYF
jgi:hypothetical protein